MGGLLDCSKSSGFRLGAPILDVLAPGISPDDVDALTEPYGLRVPVEVKTLWEWHNGILTDDPYRADYSIGPGSYDFLSVQGALAEYESNREHHGEPMEPETAPEMYWHKSWLPFMVQQAERLYVDCDRTVFVAWGEAPVRLVGWAWESFDVDVAPSVKHAVSIWTWLLEQDYYRVEQADGQRTWQVDYMAIPEFLRVSGLA